MHNMLTKKKHMYTTHPIWLMEGHSDHHLITGPLFGCPVLWYQASAILDSEPFEWFGVQTFSVNGHSEFESFLSEDLNSEHLNSGNI